MKTLSTEEMEKCIAGKWLNNHTWQEHLICIGQGVLGSAFGPLGTISAMVFCYASS